MWESSLQRWQQEGNSIYYRSGLQKCTFESRSRSIHVESEEEEKKKQKSKNIDV